MRSPAKGSASSGRSRRCSLIAAILALAAALASAIWHGAPRWRGCDWPGRRPARLRAHPAARIDPDAGCRLPHRRARGLYGQLVIDGYLRDVTGFPLATLDRGPTAAGAARARDRDRARARRRPRLAGRASLANPRARGVELSSMIKSFGLIAARDACSWQIPTILALRERSPETSRSRGAPDRRPPRQPPLARRARGAHAEHHRHGRHALHRRLGLAAARVGLGLRDAPGQHEGGLARSAPR